MNFVETIVNKLTPKSYFTTPNGILSCVKKKETNLDKLRELTKDLSEIPTLGFFVKEITDDGVIYEKDNLWGIKICNIPNVLAAQKIYMTKGYTMPVHRHEELEIGIIKRGKIRVDINSKSKVFNADDVVYLLSNQSHSVTALENVEAIFITVPPAEGFPE
jgi:quercetin dioxygenase-like cupin family protein